MFEKAVKAESKLRLALAGPSGSGKTYSALSIASHLTDKSIALVDTEHGSASKYADLFSFDVLNLDPPFHPDRFLDAIREAEKAGYGVIILDSLSHAWSGTGGLLDIVDEIAKKNRNPNTFAAWKDATPIQNRLIDGLLMADIHLIATMRSKQEYILQENQNGRQVPKKVGMAPVQRDGFEYEFDVFIDLDVDNTGLVSKTRCPALSGKVIKQPGKETADVLREWLKGERVIKQPPVKRDETPAPVIIPQQNNGKEKDLTKSTSWPKAWLDTIIHNRYADSVHEAAGMLAKSKVVKPENPLTPALVGGWAKHYRGERDLDKTPESAAEYADSKLSEYLSNATGS